VLWRCGGGVIVVVVVVGFMYDMGRCFFPFLSLLFFLVDDLVCCYAMRCARGRSEIGGGSRGASEDSAIGDWGFRGSRGFGGRGLRWLCSWMEG
jgi:hypothetical protein